MRKKKTLSEAIESVIKAPPKEMTPERAEKILKQAGIILEDGTLNPMFARILAKKVVDVGTERGGAKIIY